MTHNDLMREAFEKALTDPNLYTMTERQFDDPWLQQRWCVWERAWQAALSTRPANAQVDVDGLAADIIVQLRRYQPNTSQILRQIVKDCVNKALSAAPQPASEEA